MKILNRILILLTLSLVTQQVVATHLVGGNLGYTYLGETAPGSQIYRYQINMQFYMNCGDNSNFETFQDLLNTSQNGTLPVGVYLQDPQNPNSDKVQQAIVELALISDIQIVPPFPPGCDVGDGLCTLLGDFQGTVDLPLNFNGYHLYFQMCCRNLDISNLNNPNQTGIGYYAYIPPTLVQNSSPIFFGVPTPFLCTADTSTFINSASDPDGDQLIFSFEKPYNSISIAGGVQNPPGTLPWPIPEVTYGGGYSIAQPFGAGGYSFINGATGLTRYLSPIQGNYVIAVEIKEFRNGQLIGRTRRDLQLQVVPCAPNTTPAVSGTLPLSYTVDAGDQLCFDMNFGDTDVDSLFLTASGTIFDGTQFNPPATITPIASAIGTAAAQFCWATACEQGQSQPYLFSVTVVDNGCPPKNLDVVFQVNVVPFVGPTVINGPLQICSGVTGSVYSTDDISGATYNWVVNGGTLVSGQSTSDIVVDWGPSGAGSVLVSATNSLGCTSDQISTSVSIAALPVANAGADITICDGDSIAIGGSPTGPGGSSFSWSPSATLNSGSNANPEATPLITTDYIVLVSNSGCTDQDTIRVNVSVPSVSAGTDLAVCVGDSVQIQAQGTGSVVWSPAGGLSATNVLDPFAFPIATTDYIVTLTDSATCIAQDTIQVLVNQLPVANAGADTSACTNEMIVIGGAPTGPSGSTYTWSPAGGLSDANSANPTATITGTQIYTVTVTDSSTCSSTDVITINALAIPNVDAGPDTTICAGSTVQLNGTGSGTLQWTPIFGLSDPDIGNPFANPEATVTYTLTVTGGNLCVNTDQTTVTVNVLPNANAGPDLSICAGDSIQLQATGPGTYNWSPANTLSDPNAPTPFASPLVTTTYVLTLSDPIACANTDTVVVSVSVPANAGTNGSTTLCGTSGQPITLIDLVGGTPDPGGIWTGPNNTSSDGTYVPGTSLEGDYTYTLQSPAPCSPSTAVVSVIVIPDANAGDDSTLNICNTSPEISLFTVLGGSPQSGGSWVDGNSMPNSGIFDPATGTSQTFTYTVPGIAPCTDDQSQVVVNVIPAPDPGTDASFSTCTSGVPFDMTSQLGGTPDPTGTWTSPSNVSHGSNFDPAIDEDGVWVFTVPGGVGCPDQLAELTITATTPNSSISGDDTICIGDTTQLSNSGNAIYLWTPATDISDPAIGDPLFFPTTTTVYTLTVTDTAGCIGSSDITITVNALPMVDAGPDATACTGLSVTIGGSPTGPTGSTYTWEPSAELNDATSSNPDADPTQTTTFIVTVSDGNQCVNSDSVVVNIVPLPTLDAGPDSGLCIGGSVQLNATGAGQFQWTPNDGLDADNIADPVASPAATTLYTVTLTDGNNCVNTDDILVSVNAIPTVSAGDDRYLCPGFAAQLNGSGTGNASWSPTTDLNDPASPTPQASPVITTTYTLTITDGNGCTASDAMNVQVSTDPPLDPGPDQTICDGQPVILGGNPTTIPGVAIFWNPASDLNDATLLNPTASPTGTTIYTVTAQSDTCTSQGSVTVTIQGSLNVQFDITLEPNCDGVRAFFTDASSGATSWFWDFGDGATSTQQNPQHQFAYGGSINVTLTVSDGVNCDGMLTQTIDPGNFSDHVSFDIPNVFSPNGDGVNDVFTFNTDAILGACTSMEVFNRWGQVVFQNTGNNIIWDGRSLAGETCVDGTYFYTIVIGSTELKGNVFLSTKRR
ncbi:MAG: gliding motility-associated C-terminal domain-containing protein [Flavobacteriales bacterium]|nr:gliding motility-associated C-terminal domain-containing protein [Flavobacteriales bacterium]